MIPRLALRGKYVLGTALLFLVVGTLHGAPPLVALAGAVLSVLLALYLVFYPTAILLRRKKIELSWWVPPGDQPGGALAVDRPFQLHLAFRNHGSRKLRILSSHILAATGLAIDERPSATVRRGQQVEVTTTMRALAAGYHVLHGAALTFGDALGLFDIEAFFPNPIAVKVFPRTAALRGQAVRAISAARARARCSRARPRCAARRCARSAARCTSRSGCTACAGEGCRASCASCASTRTAIRSSSSRGRRPRAASS
jgi:uncharacterized protein (DUF58 family)